MNVALGGNLNQAIENHWQDAPTDYLYHKMPVKPNTKLAEIYGSETTINSFHHQSIKELSPYLDWRNLPMPTQTAKNANKPCKKQISTL